MKIVFLFIIAAYAARYWYEITEGKRELKRREKQLAKYESLIPTLLPREKDTL